MGRDRELLDRPRTAGHADRAPVAERNRRTATILLVWIALLMAASVAVAWLRN